MQTQTPFSPQKEVDEILALNKGEAKAGKAAVHLAQYVFFGTDEMRRNTAATLDTKDIKHILVGKYGAKMYSGQKCPLGQVPESNWTEMQISSP